MDVATLINTIADRAGIVQVPTVFSDSSTSYPIDVILVGRQCVNCETGHSIGHFEVGDVLHIKNVELTDTGRIRLRVGE